MALFDDYIQKETISLSPDTVNQKLSYFYVQAHDNHLNSVSFEEHKALNTLYEELVGFKDKIGELLLGYISPKRFNPDYSLKIVRKPTNQLIEEGIKFSKDLYEWAEGYDWLELCNLSADLEGLFVSCRYKLTLK